MPVIFAGPAVLSALQNLHPVPDGKPVDNIPVERIEEVCGLYFRSVLLEQVNIIIPQHEHDHDHATFVASGKARAWADGSWIGDYEAGSAVKIKAGSVHIFQALEPMTRLVCVHDIASAESVKRKGI